jgi:hypothetical protein
VYRCRIKWCNLRFSHSPFPSFFCDLNVKSVPTCDRQQYARMSCLPKMYTQKVSPNMFMSTKIDHILLFPMGVIVGRAKHALVISYWRVLANLNISFRQRLVGEALVRINSICLWIPKQTLSTLFITDCSLRNIKLY